LTPRRKVKKLKSEIDYAVPAGAAFLFLWLAEKVMPMNFAGRSLDMASCHVMGVLNVTPDSFSDGGRFNGVGSALARAREMVNDGAAFIDVGGESTRPGATPVPLQEELDRVCPAVEAIVRELDVIVSVDTSAPEVMSETMALGAGLINDVRALQRPGAPEAIARTGVPVCMMHIQGEPDHMQDKPSYRNVLQEVSSFLSERLRVVEAAGVGAERIILDPGFGFGKTVQHNFQLLAALEQLQQLGHPLLVGMSRKSMLGHVTGRDVSERLSASVAAATIAAIKGASIIRAHDVRETVDAVKVVAAMEEAGR
jgi:dihydropteroate synthase